MSATPTIQTIIGRIDQANASRSNLTDNKGSLMACLKIIPDPGQKGYLAAYTYADAQGIDRAAVATSTDLLHWTWKTVVDSYVTQAYITALTDGSFIVSSEFAQGTGGHVRLVHFKNRANLLTGVSDASITLPRTLSNCNEGTPNLYSVKLVPDLAHSVIHVGYHYHRDCDVDRQAVGILLDFDPPTWSGIPDDDVNNAVQNAAVAIGTSIGGNIGQRDYVVYDGAEYNLIEAQYTKGDFGTWNAYLHHWKASIAEEIEMTGRNGGAMGSVGNPRITHLIGPNGKPAVVVTFFVFDGGWSDEWGPTVYWREYTPDPTFASADYRAKHNKQTPVPTNGVFNEATVRAVQFVGNVIPPDGVWSWQARADVQARLGRPQTGTLTQGPGDTDVAALQRRIGMTGTGPSGVDGYLGPNTYKAWQKALNEGRY